MTYLCGIKYERYALFPFFQTAIENSCFSLSNLPTPTTDNISPGPQFYDFARQIRRKRESRLKAGAEEVFLLGQGVSKGNE